MTSSLGPTFGVSLGLARPPAGLLIAAGLSALCAFSDAAAMSYTFTDIADTTATFSRFGVFPSVNSAGTVAFEADLANGQLGIFTGRGGPVTTIAQTGVGSPFGSFGFPVINQRGTVAFVAGTSAGTSIFTATRGAVTPVVDNIPPPFEGFADPSLNGAGMLAFVAELKTGELQVLKGTGAPFTVVADNRGTIDGFVSNRTAINARGTVAFSARLKDGGAGVFAGRGGNLTAIADTAGIFSGFGEAGPTINNQGKVAFLGDLKSGGQGVFVGTGRTLTTIADTREGFSLFVNTDINNRGTVAFAAFLDAGGEGIFTGADLTADRVIGTGDVLDGATVTRLGGAAGLSRIDLNDRGQFAFVATLSDGREGIFRADPALEPTPEPTTLLLWGTMIAGLGFAARRAKAQSGERRRPRQKRASVSPGC
jgi:hypothetical protein